MVFTYWQKNLENCLRKFDLDHIFFSAHRAKRLIMLQKSLNMIGDACWHCHVGADLLPYKLLFDWRIKLIVYGEAPADTDARGNFKKK